MLSLQPAKLADKVFQLGDRLGLVSELRIPN